VGAALYAVAAMQATVPSSMGRWRDVLYLLIAAPSVWALVRASRRRGMPAANAHAWRFLALSAALWFAGDVLRIAEGWRAAGVPIHGGYDIAFLAFYPFAMHAVACFPGLGGSQTDRWRLQLDAFIASLMVAAVFAWHWPVPQQTGGSGPWLMRLVHMANPVGDLMLLTSIMVLRSRQKDAGSRHLLRTVVLALCAKTLADMLHAYSVIDDTAMLNGITGFVWLAFYNLMTLSAVRGHRVVTADRVNVQRLVPLTWLPYASVMLTGSLLLIAVFGDNVSAARWMAVVTIVLSLAVLLRQGLAAYEDRRRDQVAAVGAAEGRLAALVRHSHDLVIVIDAEGTMRYVSPSIERILGMGAEQLHGQSIHGLVHPDDFETARAALARVLESKEEAEHYITRVQHGAGGWRHLETVATNRLDTDSITGIVLNLRDVTERRELEGQLHWQAFHDPLTKLANRMLFSDRVAHALARRQRHGHDLGVLFIDLDRFKTVNDTLGHHAGDDLLKEAARRIVQEVRAADTVARLGGDEFAVLLEEASAEHCQQTAQRLLDQLTRAFSLDGREVFSGASIGLAMAEPGATLEEIVSDADVAMYAAKAEGRGRVVTFERNMREHATDRLALEADLRRALDRNELTVVYQPQVDLRNGDILGAEALVRWNHPTRGLIPPSRFVPIAEQAGLMVAMSRFVLRTATREAAQWRQADIDGQVIHVAVNLSGRHVQDASLLHDVREALADSLLDPSLLTVEITESVMMHNTSEAVAVLSELKALGIKVAVDDFGTGYSSLSYLQQFPVDVLKIDKRFIDTLGAAEGDHALTRAILSLGDALGLATVAEGIETPRQLTELRRMGCLLGQGFLLSHPLPGRVFAELLQSDRVQQTFEQFGTPLPGLQLA
jgi:diguanylate cyclase (GGDEF)-like protein/PAS domain S-box-containing protein